MEAVQWFPGVDVPGVSVSELSRPGAELAFIRTINGRTPIRPGWWLVTFSNGHRLVVSPAEFVKEFEPILEQV